MRALARMLLFVFRGSQVEHFERIARSCDFDGRVGLNFRFFFGFSSAGYEKRGQQQKQSDLTPYTQHDLVIGTKVEELETVCEINNVSLRDK